jgi:hypothetical protein
MGAVCAVTHSEHLTSVLFLQGPVAARLLTHCAFLSTAGAVIGISCAVVVLLYFFQRLGTSKLGHFFAPVILVWFFANFCIGIYNIVVWYPGMCACPTKPCPDCLARACSAASP